MTARNCSSKIVNSTLKYQTVLMAGLQKFFKVFRDLKNELYCQIGFIAIFHSFSNGSPS